MSVSVRPTERDFEQVLPALPESVPRLRHGVTRFAGRVSAPDRVRRKVALAVSEACTNVVVHAYRGVRARGRAELAVRAERRGPSLRVWVRDNGCGPRPRSDSPGLGLGAPLMAVLADRVEIRENPEGPGTLVTLEFRIEE